MLPELVDWFKALAKTSIARFRSQYADPPTAFCRHRIQPQVRRQHQIPIAPVAPPVLNLPRLRALALFGRRPPQRADRPAFRQPKTSTNPEILAPSTLSPLCPRKQTFGVWTWMSRSYGHARKSVRPSAGNWSGRPTPDALVAMASAAFCLCSTAGTVALAPQFGREAPDLGRLGPENRFRQSAKVGRQS